MISQQVPTRDRRSIHRLFKLPSQSWLQWSAWLKGSRYESLSPSTHVLITFFVLPSTSWVDACALLLWHLESQRGSSSVMRGACYDDLPSSSFDPACEKLSQQKKKGQWCGESIALKGSAAEILDSITNCQAVVIPDFRSNGQPLEFGMTLDYGSLTYNCRRTEVKLFMHLCIHRASNSAAENPYVRITSLSTTTSVMASDCF